MKNSRNNRNPNEYIVTTFKNKKIQQSTVTFNELQKIKKESVRLYVNEETGEISFQPPEGDRKSFNIGEQGLGGYEWPLLVDIIWELGGWHKLVSANYVNARVYRLRDAFGDSGGEQWLFETRKNPTYSIRLRPKISWIFIEKCAKSSEESKN
ncbi:MAG: hypothetical protein ABIG61_01720 [Planctomycetota bacterium]